jgi:hypothetical protein
MQLRHILEYEDHEIQDLMGDLDSVGQMKSLQGTLWARFATYKLGDDRFPSWSASPEIMCFLKTEPFFATGDHYHVDRDESIMLQKIQKGAFDRVLDPNSRAYMSLKVGSPMAMGILEKSNIQSLSRTCTSMDELIGKIRKSLVQSQEAELTNGSQLMKTRYPYNLEAASTVLVYGFIAPVGSPYLDTFDMSKPFIKGDAINHQS